MELEDGDVAFSVIGEGRPCIAQRDDADDAVKRKRPVQLLVGDKVEVRSVDEGLLGSWHSGVVIECKNGARKVQYDNVLCEDGSQRLNDCISVHPVVDGVPHVGRKRLYYRSFIRPTPPPLNLDRLSVRYGQCVDAYYKEAWWEGVVFDHENTSGVRSIFFPDIGDILQVGVDVLRITQDWDEYTRDWKPRGTWHFLQLIDRVEQKNLLHVSLRQIWYEVREKKAFHILKEWTNSVTRRDLWESLVREVIDDHSKLAAENFCGEVVESMLTREFERQLTAADNNDEILDLSRSRSKSATHVEQSPSTQDLIQIACISNSNTNDEDKLHSAPTLVPCIANSTDDSKDLNVVCEQVPTNKKRKFKWEVPDTDRTPVAEFCPGSVVEYRNRLRSNHKGISSSLALNMRKHLAYLDWKMETRRVDGKPRMRYTSPEGKAYMSLSSVCKDWDYSTEEKGVCFPDIVEPANFYEVVENNALLGSGEKNENTELPVTAKPDDIEDEAKMQVMASDSPIRTKEALKTFNSPTTACETYANGEVDKSVKAAVILEPRQKIIVGDEGAEVNDVSLVTNEEEIRLNILSFKSTTEEDGKKLDTSLSCSSNSATNVERFHGALLMNYNKSSGLQGSSPISDDFCSHISEGPAEKNNTEHDLDTVPEVKICADSLYKLKMEGGTRLNLISSSNSQTTHEETPCSLPSILPCNTAAVDKVSKLEDLNILVKELPSKRKRKRNWEIAGRDLVPDAEFCPSSVVEYRKSSRNKHVKLSTLKLNMRKHLAYLGWEIEVCREEGFPRMCYTSPDGKTYMSLETVCKDLDPRSDQCEEKTACASPHSLHALISSPLPHDIVEPAYLSETVKYYGLLGSGENNKNTAWPRIAKPDGIGDVENTRLMASESPIRRNEALKTFNSLSTACETYADGGVDRTADKAEISDPGKNTENGDEASGKLIASESFPSRVLNEQAEVKSMLVGEHHYERINGVPPLTCNDDDVGTEVKDVSLVTEKGESHVDVYLSKSYTGLQGSNPVSNDFCPRKFEKFSEKRDYYGCQIAGNNVNIVPKADISPRSIYNSKMEGGSRLSLTNISNLETAREDICCSSVTTACEAYAVGEVNDGMGTALASEPKQNKKVGDTIQRSPSNLPIELVEFEKDKSLATVEYLSEETDGVPHLTCKSLVQREVKNTGGSENKERKEFALSLSAKVSDDMDDGHCSERSVRVLDSSFSVHSSRSILPALIDNDVVLPHAKVYYRKKSGDPIKEGKITREGIKCNCCQNVFGLSKFEAHTGSTYHRPAANIFLEDGRSLSECQSQLKSRDNLKNMLTPPLQPKRNREAIKNIARPSPQPKVVRDDKKKIKTPSPQHKRSRHLSTNDCTCSVCTLGGQLTFCNHCPSSFHRECLGLKVIPEGEWFCPSCCCGICGKNKFNSGAKKIMDGSMLNCYQCERQYHVGCLLKEGDTNLDRCSNGRWFCNRKCQQIFVGLRRLLGRPVVVGEDNLTWTLLKYTPHDDGLDDAGLDLGETLNSLRLAESVMQECFHPVKEPRTKIDIVKDVIFSRSSNLKRLNFQGFYTVLLSRDDDLISVAAVRVYGEKVAEVPLIGTRFEYRQHGMCRLLMNVLEKKLMELGVERLVFLATPSVLRAWTASFGFSKISESERFNLLGYTFLDFQGTAMCHKILTNSVQPTRTQQNFCNGVDKSDNADVNKNSLNLEVFQAKQIDVEILHQGTADVALSGRSINGGNGTSPLILRV